MLFLLFWVISVIPSVISVPHINNLDSDLTILIDNDIQGLQNPDKDSAVLILSPQSQTNAASSCKALNEKLWPPSAKGGSMNSSLDYLIYQGNYPPNQRFWISSTQSGPRAINGRGEIKYVSKSTVLPVICTQTAPFSNATFQDNNEDWQITVSSATANITGFRDRLSFRFLGIRYASQPERFTYSTPYKGTESQAAVDYGNVCIHADGSGSEDCLFLNIWTPFLPLNSGTSKNLKAVMFYLYGAGGNANDPSLDGSTLASRGDVVSVVLNYREGTFGNLVLDDGTTNGNFGFADQITALDWVRENIRTFGGDPNRITIVGESFGAIYTMSMLESPKAAGKFSAAIAQSYTAGSLYGTVYANRYDISDVYSTVSAAILQATNCTSNDSAIQLSCLRALPASTLATLPTVAYFLTDDGVYFTSKRLNLNKSSPVAHVPLMIGFLRDDGASFTSFPTTDNLTTELTNQGYPAAEIIASGKFPLPPGTNTSLNIFNVTSRVSTDSTFRCLGAAAAYAGVQNNLFPSVYLFEFNRSYQAVDWNPVPNVCLPPKTPSKPLGDLDGEYFKCHAAEMYYTFGTLARNGVPLRDENDLKFEQFIIDTWTSFARTHDPNPKLGFLKARGYVNTTAEIEMAGIWKPVGIEGLLMRVLQSPSIQLEWTEQEQCDVLGFPLNYYLD